jgi:hypothetical protein
MKPTVRSGSLPIDFAVPPFGSPIHLLARSAALFFSNFVFIVSVTLAVFLPAKAALHFACWALDLSTKGLTMYAALSASDLVLASLVTPAVIYGLMVRLRGKPAPPLAEALRWGRRQWGRTLWNRIKVEITVSLSLLLLVVPGVIAMIRLAFTDAIVAIEGDRTTAVLERSSALSDGHRWRIFFVMLPVGLVEMVGSYFVLGAFSSLTSSRLLLAVMDAVLSAGGQGATVVVLLMYLGLAEKQ